MTRAQQASALAPSAIPLDASRAAHFEALVESSEDAILSKDRDAVITSWNPAAERLYGYSAEEAIGRPIRMLVPPDRANEERVILGRILLGERLQHYETERLRKDGSRVSVWLTISPIRLGEEIIGASVIARDITRRVRARERATRLQEITSALAREAEPERAIKVLVSAGAEALAADAATVGLLDSTRERVVLADHAGHSAERLAGFQSFPLEAELPMCVAIREQTAIWDRDPERLNERFPGLAEEPVSFGSLAVLPLIVEGNVLGAASFSFREAKEFEPEDRAFIATIVQQAAYTIDRARIYEAERSANRRLAFLGQASEALNEPLSVASTLQRLAELSVRSVSDWCTVDLVRGDGQIESVVIEHVDRSKAEMAREFRLRYPPDPEAEAGTAHVIRSGEPELYRMITDEMLAESAQDEGHLEMARELGLVSAMIVPLIARGRTLGAMTFASSNPRRTYDEDDLELVTDLGRRAALAIDTSVLYQREHDAAVTLQRALLPQLPELEHVELAARYLPAEAEFEVGGDWYDVVRSDPGRVNLVIGDMAGRGIDAASVMGRLATALRAYLLDGYTPERALSALDRLMKEFEAPTLATLFVLSLDPETGRAQYVRAGHPPALLRRPDGEVLDLTGEGSPPVGPLRGPRFLANEIEVEPGSTLLLYTDGLIERRRVDLQAGIDALQATFAVAPDEPQALVDAIPGALGAEGVADDIALLAVRLT
jgi:PAS domain S-box-containing protein